MSWCCFFLRIRRLPGPTLTDTLLPYTRRFRSVHAHPVAGPQQRQAAHGRRFGRGVEDGGTARSPRLPPVPDAGQSGHALGDEVGGRSEEHTSELQSLMRISYAVFCLKKNKTRQTDENSKHPPPQVYERRI